MFQDEVLEYIDISPVLSNELAVFPGDNPFLRTVTMSTQKGDHITLSKVSSTLHAGSHADAPLHFHPKGKTIDQLPLQPFIGPCQVISTQAPKGQRIEPQHLQTQEIKNPRVLLKTNSFPNPNCWNSDFNSLAPDLIDFLQKQGVLLIGIDTPSVDPADDKNLPAHQKFYEHQISLVEGLVLSHVHDGSYFLSALPLNIQDGDASPLRAILIPFQQGG